MLFYFCRIISISSYPWKWSLIKFHFQSATQCQSWLSSCRFITSLQHHNHSSVVVVVDEDNFPNILWELVKKLISNLRGGTVNNRTVCKYYRRGRRSDCSHIAVISFSAMLSMYMVFSKHSEASVWGADVALRIALLMNYTIGQMESALKTR